MAEILTSKYEGFSELEQALKQIGEDFGYDKSGNILKKGAKEALAPVAQAMYSHAPYDPKNQTTPHLRETIRISSRFPSSRDKKSMYYKNGDVVIGEVSVKTDKRGISQEFGNARNPAHPFLRIALESQQERVIQILSSFLAFSIEKYKSKKA